MTTAHVHAMRRPLASIIHLLVAVSVLAMPLEAAAQRGGARGGGGAAKPSQPSGGSKSSRPTINGGSQKSPEPGVAEVAAEPVIAAIAVADREPHAADGRAGVAPVPTVNLASLKGKVIYIDIWATWCGPCYFEMPYFENLREKYQGNDNIAFVSLSIDDDVDRWKKDVAKRKVEGFQ